MFTSIQRLDRLGFVRPSIHKGVVCFSFDSSMINLNECPNGFSDSAKNLYKELAHKERKQGDYNAVILVTEKGLTVDKAWQDGIKEVGELKSQIHKLNYTRTYDSKLTHEQNQAVFADIDNQVVALKNQIHALNSNARAVVGYIVEEVNRVFFG